MGKVFKVLLMVGFGIFVGVGLAMMAGIVGDEARPTGARVGVVPVEGFLADARDAVSALEEFTEDDEIKSIVLRVESPGGVVAPAQEIHDQVAKSAKVKPVICSFGSVAASGGYYLSAPATKILANPGTVTGSIGVIFQLQNYRLLMDKVGLRAESIKSGPYKDTGNPMRDMSDRERAVIQGLVDDIFDQFVGAVAQGRELANEAVLELADGRIYTGRQALELGLVDQLGGYVDAVELAGELGGISGKPEVELWKKPEEGLLEILLGPNSKAVNDISAQSLSSPLRLVLPGW